MHDFILIAVLLCSALWRWRSIALIGNLGLGPLTLAFCMAASLMLAESFVRARSGRPC